MEKYYLMNGNINLGILEKDGEHFSFTRNKEVTKAFLYPYYFYQLKSENLNNEVPSNAIETFFRERGYQKDRQGIEVFLDEIGISCYDYWEIAKATNGTDISDHFHIERID